MSLHARVRPLRRGTPWVGGCVLLPGPPAAHSCGWRAAQVHTHVPLPGRRVRGGAIANRATASLVGCVSAR
eukprot:13929554-Alexandrium_andersonii.AAC.1